MRRPTVTNPEGLVTLYHGTTLDNARRIAVEGLRAPTPAEVRTALAELEFWCGARRGATRDGFEEFALRRVGEAEVCLTTGFNHAAAYARMGPEFLYQGLCAIGRALHGDDAGEFFADEHRHHTPAVVTVVAPRGEVAARAFPGRPVTDRTLDPGADDPIATSFGLAEALQLVGPLPAAWVTRVEVLDPCDCTDDLLLRGADRCPTCPRDVPLAPAP